MLIQPRRGTADQWRSANPILAVAEMGYETDTMKFKYGDGLTAWNDLDYGISAVNLSDVTALGLELMTSNTEAEARTLLGIGTGTSVNSADIVDSTSVGRILLTASTTTAALNALGGTTTGKAVFTAANAAAALSALGAGTYSKPSGGIPSTDLSSAVQAILTKADTSVQTIAVNLISDASAIGKTILTAADSLAVRNAIGAGTSNLALGTTSGTALAGNYSPSSTSINDATSVGRALLTASSSDIARSVIGAGTSNLALGTTSSTALAGNYAPTSNSLTDATVIGKALLTATDATTARAIIGAGSGTGTASITSATILDATTVGRAVLTAADAASARTAIGIGDGNYVKPTNGIPSSDLTTAVQVSLGLANSAVQSVSSTTISDASTVGKALLTAANAAAALSTLGAGTYSKPGGGIPASDLTTAVQTSLGKADSALQTVTSTTISDATAVGKSLLTASSAATALTALGLSSGTYSKPSGGIPATDLATAVQTNLTLASTALQSVSSGNLTDSTTLGQAIITASSAASARASIGAGTYSKPSGGIPSSDMNAAVQTTLGLANSALQTVPAGYVQGSLGDGTSITLTLWTGTAAQYAAIGTKSSTTVYIVTA